MKTLLICFLFITSVNSLTAQILIPNSAVNGVCYAGNKVNRVYIPPPKEFYQKKSAKGGASITINYTGFSATGKVAMEYAASILKSILPPDTKMTINAFYERISTQGVLAQASASYFVAGWDINALNPNAIYPIALAEKIAGKSLNTDLEEDIKLTVNNTAQWYMGTDGNTPLSRYDLVTVVLHEIIHGLGFFDSMNTDNTLGWYGINSIPVVYDTFIENRDGNRLADSLKFLNYSSGLRNNLIGGPLYFNGPLLKKYSVLHNYSLQKAILYTPTTWDAGSSVSHLDENLTINETDQSNQLMTPIISYAEAIHNPGKYTLSILGDIGWINTRIIHKPMRDSEDHINRVEISTTIKSDTLYNRDKVGLVFSFDGFNTSDTLFMSSFNPIDLFKTSIDIPSYNSELQYYIFVEDCFSRIYRSPSLIKYLKYRVYIGTDTVKPVISHTKTDYYLETIDTINFKAYVSDNLGVDSVYLEYKVNNSPSKFLGLKAGINDSYKAFILAKTMLLNGGDSIRYRIFAVDSAKVPNISVLPKTGYFSTKIEEISSTMQSYSTDFAGARPDFFNVGFDILKPTGFMKYGLHSKHPYESPEDNNKTIEYTALLRHPIKFNESGIVINFSEVVLVEPGEKGSVFGAADFYDYVIVEGSKNFGKTWFALTDGYDSRINPSWEASYNGSIEGDNSTFTGTESMLNKHTVYYQPSDKISAGDTLLLRFRLFSDPFANGWGWAIEDLKVNSLVDAVEKISYDPIRIYPNPGHGLINLNKSGSPIGKPIRYSVYNSSGKCIINERTMRDSEMSIDISGNPTGIYIIILYLDDGIKTIKYSLTK